MSLGVVGLALALILAGQTSSSEEPEGWLGVFKAFPGARRLCSQHVLGQSEGNRVEVQFTLYSTSREPSETARFYAEAYGVPWKPGEETVSIERAEGRKILAVHPVSAPHPECGVDPDPGDRTVIVVSEKVP